MIPATTALVQYQNVGGVTADSFDDAKAVAEWPAKLLIDTTRPISKIVVHHGDIVDSLTITYTKQGNPVDQSHGGSGGNRADVPLGATEILTAVSGRVVDDSNWGTCLVEISFVIFDTATDKTRIAGPFGNLANKSGGVSFYAPRPAAFAGFVATSKDERRCIAGLSFFRVL